MSLPANSNVASVGGAAAAAVAAYTQGSSMTGPSLIALAQSVGVGVGSAAQPSIAAGAAIALPAAVGGADAGALLQGLATAIPSFAGLGALASVFYLASTSPVGAGDDSLAHALGLGVTLPAAKLPDDAANIAGAIGEEEPAKAVPNPDGRRGGPAHQAGVAEAIADLTQKYIDDPTVKVGTEVKVDTPDGEKKTRYLDVGVTGGDPVRIVEGVQVGKQTQAGIPVARERRALSDILGAQPSLPVGFRPINNN
jgi:hypothetical protein